MGNIEKYCFKGTGRTVSSGLLLLGVVLLILLGIYVVAPNFHGYKFEEGVCRIESAQRGGRWVSCDCGTNSNTGNDDDEVEDCTSSYPCYKVGGYFKYEGNATWLYYGSFHYNYDSLQRQCLYVPVCSASPYVNEGAVERYYQKTIPQRLNRIFPCWGNGHNIYFYHSYSLAKGLAGLITPLVIVFIALIMKMAICCDLPSHFSRWSFNRTEIDLDRQGRPTPSLSSSSNVDIPAYRPEQRTTTTNVDESNTYGGGQAPPPSYDDIMNTTYPAAAVDGYSPAPSYPEPYNPPPPHLDPGLRVSSGRII